MAAIIGVFFICIFLVFYLVFDNGIRKATIKAFVITFTTIAISTELLSLFNKVTYTWVRSTWLILTAFALFFIFIKRKEIKLPRWRSSDDSKLYRHPSSPTTIFFLGSLIVFIVSITFIIALKAPPNNFDSMTYHMARVSHWIQNQSVKYYPTAIPRQNYSMPLAEFGILHLQLLSKTDQYANFIQWFSFILSIILSTQIAKEFNLTAKGQLISGLLTATLPMAILQSTSTQNDLVVGVFCLSFAYFLLKVIKDKTWEDVIFTSLSMGLALLTKGTSYVFCASIGVSIGGIYLIGKNLEEIKRNSIRYLVIVIVALLLNVGVYARNFQLYGNPILTSVDRTTIDQFSLKILNANLIRNGAVHLGTPISKSNALIVNTISNLLGEEINNPASTFGDSKFQVSFNISDDYSGNLLHFLLLSLSFLIIPLNRKDQKTIINQYLLSIVISIIFFSAMFKWQPWGSRLQAPIFLLGSALMGCVLDKIKSRQGYQLVLLIIFFITSLPFLFLNPIRPFLPLYEDDTIFYNTPVKEFFYTRIDKYTQQYPIVRENISSFMSIFYQGRSVFLTKRKELNFLGHFDYYHNYNVAKNVVRDYNPQEVGLLMDSNDWEYPLWVFLKRHASQGNPIIYHINVDNESAALNPQRNPYPEIIMATNDDYYQMIDYYNYELVYSSDSIQVLKLQD